jgi:hypothetical protein
MEDENGVYGLGDELEYELDREYHISKSRT